MFNNKQVAGFSVPFIWLDWNFFLAVIAHIMQLAVCTDDAFPFLVKLFYWGDSPWYGRSQLESHVSSVCILHSTFATLFNAYCWFLKPLYCLVGYYFIIISFITVSLGICLSLYIWMKLPFKSWPTTDSLAVSDLILIYSNLELKGDHVTSTECRLLWPQVPITGWDFLSQDSFNQLLWGHHDQATKECERMERKRRHKK